MGNRFVFQACLWSFLTLGCSGIHATTAEQNNGDQVDAYYNISDAHQKLVDNHGNGYEPLYGTRNVRAVLNGIYYRGGANNAFHRTHPRANQNPLPDDGLMDLCQEGFSDAVYLYSTNYSSAPKTVNCKTADGRNNQLTYTQISVLQASRAQLQTLIGMNYSHAKNPSMGPIYDHCWNGWHASGITAAYTLMQLCDFNAEQAVTYWNLNTDGNDGASYNGIRKAIRAFTKFDGMDLTAQEKAAYCPNPDTLKFN